MYLKRLETIGFKSFAERVEIDFVPGITAVVGPNGSGKSNITDAIRWVLGEQSARSLRGMKMEDIIFQGSDTRSPLNVAEVTLVLDNESQTLPLDYNEVSVTRRVYRSGESEFYINKQPCRLKDIIELFLDSGLGREAFSIIGQGRIEEILSSKADERRVIFEEAAGVLKYKQRKRKAEFKLVETEENLSRVQDIIHELETQMLPLKDQAKTAKKYNQQKKELKDEEVSLLVTEIEQLHLDWTGFLNQIKTRQEHLLAEETKNQKASAQLEVERASVDILDKEIEVYQARLLTDTEKIEQYEGKKNVLAERSKHLVENKQRAESELNKIEKDFETTEILLKKKKNTYKELHDQQILKEEEREQLESIVSFDEVEIEKSLAKLRTEYIEALNEQAVLRNRRKSISKELLQATEKSHENKEQLDLFVVNHDDLELELSESTKEIKKYQERALEQEKIRSQNEEERRKVNLKLADQEEAKQVELQQFARLQSRQEVLHEMEEELQGYFTGTKRVLLAKEDRQLTGIDGAVLQLMKFPEKYTDAFEAILGNSVQSIVTNTERDAREAIHWLKVEQIGRATFLPLDSIQRRTIPASVLKTAQNHPNFIGVASGLVEVTEQYKKIAEHLMGNIIITENLTGANEIAKLVQRRYRIVTIEGDVVNPGGSMSGGSKSKNRSSLFTREKELQTITQKSIQSEKDLAELNNKIEHIQDELLILDSQEQVIEKDLTKLKFEEQKLMEEHQVSEQALFVSKERLRLYHSSHEQFTKSGVGLTEEKNLIIGKQASLEQKIEQVAKRVQSEEDLLKTNRSERLEAENEIHRVEKELVQISERILQAKSAVDMTEETIEKLNSELITIKEELTELIELERMQKETEALSKQFSELQKEKQSVVNYIKESRTKRHTLSQQISDRERELVATNRENKHYAKKLQQEEIQANRLDVALDNRLNQLQEEYEMSFERALERYEQVSDIPKSKQIVRDLKQSIGSLGPVNLGAIEEYDRIVERFSFLEAQQTDLQTAKDTLFEAIAKLDKEMKQIFSAVFSQIQKEFSIVFKRLFGGGSAELELTDEDDLLETGIEIIAQPPGKKLRNLSLLSGGERALTAIALLFAILRVRPVPFCILDEVEAALDEVNVTRFAQYLHNYSEDTQFIVITHRKGTMEEADVLYGVTMEESGVSRLVSVRLSDLDEVVES